MIHKEAGVYLDDMIIKPKEREGGFISLQSFSKDSGVTTCTSTHTNVHLGSHQGDYLDMWSACEELKIDPSMIKDKGLKNICNQLSKLKTHYPIQNFGYLNRNIWRFWFRNSNRYFFRLLIWVRFGHFESSGTQIPETFFLIFQNFLKFSLL